MKKINFARILWVSSFFLILIIILIAVIDYKVNYEYLTSNNLYFYDSEGILSVTEVKNDNYLLYSKYQCGYDECPVLKSELNDDLVLLIKDDITILFNYRTGVIISSDYDNYQMINNNYYIVTKDGKQGIIDGENNLTVPVIYEQLGIIIDDYLTGYSYSNIIAKKDKKYGVVSIKNGEVMYPFDTEENNLDHLLQMFKEDVSLSE